MNNLQCILEDINETRFEIIIFLVEWRIKLCRAVYKIYQNIIPELKIL